VQHGLDAVDALRRERRDLGTHGDGVV